VVAQIAHVERKKYDTKTKIRRGQTMLIGLIGLSTITQPAVSTIASTIQTVEGYYPGSIAYTNNNPGNLIYVGQLGAVKGPAMPGTPYYYAQFSTYDAGEAALANQIQTYANQGLTINQMMAKYAPATDANGNPTGNNPTAYANTIAAALGVSPDTTISDALAGNATAGVPAVDTSGVFDSVDTAFSDLGGAISSGDFSSVSGTDWGVLLAGVALVFVGGWAIAR
jgi:hypothetical protein